MKRECKKCIHSFKVQTDAVLKKAAFVYSLHRESITQANENNFFLF